MYYLNLERWSDFSYHTIYRYRTILKCNALLEQIFFYKNNKQNTELQTSKALCLVRRQCWSKYVTEMIIPDRR